jgi:protein-S-isoprenylcysteine O-methyltransferase Ste14
MANRSLAAIGNAVVVFVTFLISIPAMVMPMTRGWLKLHGYMTVVCAIFTLILGLFVWFETLTSRSRLGVIWGNLPSQTQSLIQQQVSSPGCVLWRRLTWSS